jgi:hypothetical protein
MKDTIFLFNKDCSTSGQSAIGLSESVSFLFNRDCSTSGQSAIGLSESVSSYKFKLKTDKGTDDRSLERFIFGS